MKFQHIHYFYRITGVGVPVITSPPGRNETQLSLNHLLFGTDNILHYAINPYYSACRNYCKFLTWNIILLFCQQLTWDLIGFIKTQINKDLKMVVCGCLWTFLLTCDRYARTWADGRLNGQTNEWKRKPFNLKFALCANSR